MNDTPGVFVADTAFSVPPMPEQERMLEAVLFATSTPLSARDLAARLPRGSDVQEALAGLRRRYQDRGVHLVRTGETWAFRTAADLGHLMRREVVEPRKLSRAAIETLAIIAYHQPATRAEIEEIRGVSVSGGTLDMLLEIGWVKLGRRRASPGRPLTYVVTEGFLDHFGLETARDLPGIAELRAAGLLDNRPAPEAMPGPESEDDGEDGVAAGNGGLFD